VVAKSRLLASFFCYVGACISVKRFRVWVFGVCSGLGSGFRG